jgi:(2R)-sulfolactate sulfo-lyase subunit alpha
MCLLLNFQPVFMPLKPRALKGARAGGSGGQAWIFLKISENSPMAAGADYHAAPSAVELCRFITSRGKAMTIHFVVHDEGDSVGVVVVEGLKAGATLNGWIMDQDKMMTFDAKSDIPIGHKLAIRAIAKGDTIMKYGVDIGRAIADIAPGAHLHVHNVKTKRW